MWGKKVLTPEVQNISVLNVDQLCSTVF